MKKNKYAGIIIILISSMLTSSVSANELTGIPTDRAGVGNAIKKSGTISGYYNKKKQDLLFIEKDQFPISNSKDIEVVTVKTQSYTVKSNALSVRQEPSSDSRILSFAEMTDEEKEDNGQLSEKGLAYYKKGYTFSAMDLVFISENESWVKTPSGYVCLESAGTKYLEANETSTTYERRNYSGVKMDELDKKMENDFIVNSKSKDEALSTKCMDKPCEIENSGNTKISYIEKDEDTVQEALVNEYKNLSDTYSEDEVYLVAQLVYNEARGEGAAGQLAVAEVVKNRVDSDKFPSDVRSVIYQKGQFADNHLIAKRKPSKELIALVDSVLNGGITLFGNSDVLYFRNAKGYTGSWGRLPHYATVNHHEFYLG